ncbi:MAG: hypothetical protein H6844_18740 [Alphaproteobacteria bacterium]|nr:hypothetical protein [Alphaproteobacteria bacterium]
MKRLSLVLVAAAMMAAATRPAAAENPVATHEHTATMTAEVRAIDQKTREVVLRDENGNYVTVVASPDVRNFERVKVGDHLTVAYYESVAAHLADAGSADAPAGATVVERAGKGEMPAMVTAEAVNMVVEFIHYDPDSQIATYINPDGKPDSVFVNPDMAQFAASLKKGDKVDVTVTRAVAVSMEPSLD